MGYVHSRIKNKMIIGLHSRLKQLKSLTNKSDLETYFNLFATPGFLVSKYMYQVKMATIHVP